MQYRDIKSPTIEILISTVNRTSLSFLFEMFANNNHNDFKILIINQSKGDCILSSEFDHIKIINCSEFGVPKSRNMAIDHASGDLCLMADDDIVYLPHLKETILKAHRNHPDAAMVSFEAQDEHGVLYTNYNKAGLHNKRSLTKIYTWVISFKRQAYLQESVFYNNHFGFGAAFEGSEEYVFLRIAFDKGLTMVHVSETIVIHPSESSGRFMGSNRAIASRAAVKYRFSGNLSYIWLLKYVVFMWKDDYITCKEIPYKFKIGLQGIQTYKALKASGEIDKIYVGKNY